MAVEFKTLIAPVGIVRILEVIFTLITVSLVGSLTHQSYSLWVWCIFTWSFCVSVSLLILILELFGLSARLPISWNDFTTSFAMLATLMVLAASIIYPVFYACSNCGIQIGATVTSILAFILYAVEVGLTRAKSGEISGFLATVPGLLKVLEAFVACIIFICLEESIYSHYVGLQWCVAVYSIWFIFSLLVIILTIGRLLAYLPFEKILIVCNVLAVLMYMTAVVIWPVYVFRNNPRPSYCSTHIICRWWDNLVVISFMTCVNLVAYVVDTVYSFRLVFVSTT
ncbi:myeloid-associated differentiation marker homolog [Scomber japonicus]|uniref:myeloid-associated differentiation marker homolog n=1 Tax=Scomber japonicus TaxID=13676 RepID=UPI00230519FC|nr:myeloid-associated differentiation marker homolog [Scomber japonicus]